MERLLLKPEETAKVTGLGRTKTYKLIAKGELPSVRIGRAVRVPVAALERWIAERTQGGTTEGGR